MQPHEVDRWLSADGDTRIDLRSLYGRPRAMPRLTTTELVLDRISDESTAEALEALVDAVPEPRPPRRRRLLSTRAVVRIVSISALLSFVLLAVRWEIRGGHHE
jgi:hypothetical protein